jgi:hypothetical protein
VEVEASAAADLAAVAAGPFKNSAIGARHWKASHKSYQVAICIKAWLQPGRQDALSSGLWPYSPSLKRLLKNRSFLKALAAPSQVPYFCHHESGFQPCEGSAFPSFRQTA